MQRYSSRKLRIKLTCRITNAQGTIETTSKRKKSSLVAWLQDRSFTSAFLKAEYEPGFWNSATINTLSDAKKCLKLFTEKDLLDFIEETRCPLNTKVINQV